jgi:hypothetical protein
MALVSIGTFLLSKEYFVIEHDFYVGLALAAVLTGGITSNIFGLDWRIEVTCGFFLIKKVDESVPDPGSGAFLPLDPDPG